MADEIIQVMGFDATQAIQAIRSLNKELGALETQLKDVAAASGGKGITVIASELDGVDKAVKRTKGSVDSFNRSLGQISKIVKTQLIVRAFTTVSQALRGSIDAAREFQLAVAEIQTLTDQLDVRDELQATAEAFGFDILDIAEAKYQLLSNQVEGAQDNIEAFEASLKLARATSTSATDAVNAISSVLNSFGLNATQAEEAAGQLFTLVEQGRVRLGEIANQIGTVSALSDNLGVSFSEGIAAPLAVITRQGVRANVALTQLRGIYNKLLKPSEALQRVFKDLGVDDAVEGIRAFGGLVPFLRAINNEAQNNVAVQSELFNNVRGLSGLLNLFAQNGDNVNAVLAELGISGVDSVEKLNEAFEKVNQTDAAEFEKAVAGLKNELLDFGETALPITTKAIETVRLAIDGVADNLGTLLTVAAGGAAVFGSFATSAGLASAGVGGIGLAASLALGPVGLLTALVTAGALAWERYKNQLPQGAIDDIREGLARFKAEIKTIREEADRSTQNLNQLDSEISGLARTIREANAQGNRDFINAVVTGANQNKAILDDLLKARKKFYDDVVKKAEDSEKKITKLTEKEADARRAVEQKEFDTSLRGRDKVTQAFLRAQRVEEQVQIGRDLINEGEIEEGIKILEDQLKEIQRAVSEAESSGNRTAIVKADKAELTVLKDIANARKAQRIEAEKQGKIAAENAAEQAGRLSSFEQQLDIIQDINKQLADPNLSEDQRNRLTEQLGDAVSELQRTGGLTEGDRALADALGLDTLADDITNKLSNIKVNIDANQEELQQKLDVIAPKLRLTVPIDFIEDLQAEGLVDEISQGDPTRSLDTGSANLTEELTKSRQQAQLIEERAVGIAEQLRQVEKLAGRAFAFDTQQGADNVQKVFRAIAADAKLTQEELRIVEGIIRDLEAGEGGDIVNQGRLDKLEGLLDRARKETIEVGRLQAEDDPEERDRLEALNKQREAIINAQKAEKLLADTSAETTLNSLTTENSVIGTTGAVTETTGEFNEWNTQLKKSNELLAANKKIIEETPPPPAPAPAQNQMFGGFMRPNSFMNNLARGGPVMYRAGGGFTPRGTDTVPAMLSPGEFVVNAKAARQFASSLVAMNAGMRPQFRQEGGAIINNTFEVGSINLQSTGDTKNDARQLIKESRREFRRKSSSTRFF
jgi:TP901 family phage tail tape measure protein